MMENIERFADLRVGDRIIVERPYTEFPESGAPGEPDDDPAPYLRWEGVVRYVNPRGEFLLEGSNELFLEDGVMGDWYYIITRIS